MVMWSKFYHILENDIIFIVIMMLSNTAAVWAAGSNLRSFFVLEARSSIYVILLVLFLAMIAFYSKRLSNALRGFIRITSILIFMVDVFLLIKFHSILDQTKIEIILGSDPYTVREFLELYFISLPVLLVIIFLFLCLICLRHLNWNAIHFMRCYVTIGIIFLSLLGSASLVKTEYTLVHKGKVFGIALWNNGYIALPFYRVILDTYAAIHSKGSMDEIMMYFDENKEVVVENSSDTPYVIFVLGESVDRNKMSAYGYPLDNTPYLNMLIEDSTAYCFTDVISPANYTSRAMELIFSFTHKNDEQQWFTSQNMIDVARLAGYKTFWLSNQSPVGVWGNTDMVLAKRCDSFAFTNYEGGHNGTLTRPYDEELLPLLDKAMESADNKNFIVLHLTGSHESYDARYPKKFDKFQAADEITNNIEWNKVRAQYANTILYTDYLMKEIISRFIDKNAIVVYISDHGEDVYDNRDFMGHSAESVESRHMIEIPMIIYGTPKFWANNVSMKQRIKDSLNRPWCTDDMIHLVEDLMKIKSSSFDNSRSIINSDFQAQDRIYNGKVYNNM